MATKPTPNKPNKNKSSKSNWSDPIKARNEILGMSVNEIAVSRNMSIANAQQLRNYALRLGMPA